MPYAEGAGVALHYRSHGEGPAVLLVHGMAADSHAWEPLAEQLAADGLRAIALDRRGYGDSGAPEPYVATTVQEQAEDVGALLGAVGATPALLVGDGFGALVVLELLVRRPQLFRAAVLADPPLHAFVPAATPALADERTLLEQGLRDGGPGAAVRAWLADAGVADDDARTERAVASAQGFFADYAGQSSWSPSRRELRAVRVPVAVLTGPSTPAHVAAAADAVAGLVPAAERLGAGNLRASRGWSIGAWFVPILNLIRPKQLMDDTWRASDPALPAKVGSGWQERPVPGLLHAWWALFLISGVLGNVAGRRIAEAATPDARLVASVWSLLSDGALL